MTRPPEPSLRVTAVLLTLLALTSLQYLAAAQQQQASQNGLSAPIHPSQGQKDYRRGPYDDPKKSRKEQHENALVSNDVRAIVTLAPAGSDRAVRARPARSTGTTRGLSSRLPARSLQDWEVEGIVLLATVDGKMHARDRESGEHRWNLESESPMVETIYHRRNQSGDEAGISPMDDFIFLVEPSQDGSLYTYTAGMPLGLRKMDLTLKQLVEEFSPFSGNDPPVVYTGEKKNTLYTIDVSNGNVLQAFSTGNISVAGQERCQTAKSLGGLESDTCVGTLTLTRTEYIVSIASKADMQPICTIKYFEWGPNNRDKDLQLQYTASKDSKYIYSLYDGRILAIDHSGETPMSKLTYEDRYESPVARVFDVARPREFQSPDTPLILLPQPNGRTRGDLQVDPDGRVFVNCTEAGGWYALSEDSYPGVIEDANFAQCSRQELGFNLPTIAGYTDDQLRQALVGVHSLSFAEAHPGDVLHIAAPEIVPTIDYPFDTALQIEAKPTFAAVTTEYALIISILLLLISCGFLARQRLSQRSAAKFLNVTAKDNISSGTPSRFREIEQLVTESDTEQNLVKTVKFSKDHPPLEVPTTHELVDAAAIPLPDDDELETEGVTITGEAQQRGGKARRGKRGGRKQNKKAKPTTQADVEDSITEAAKQDQQSVVSITPDHANNDENGSVGLQNLIIHTKDQPLGNGSGGTFVFKGEFEGREVAVKRMLPQYFELMSQEVTMLEQSEDHPNVIRYFCRRQDQHFLYIALELCQASLYDLFKDGRGDEIVKDFYTLRDEIIRDPRRVLRQLAEGLRYLHSFRIVHRDIKPQNMLIAFPKKHTIAGFPRLVISDFGLCKTLPENVSTLIGTTGNAGTAGWKAPELIFQPRDTTNSASQPTASQESKLSESNVSLGVKRAIDIFSMGCVFFYVLTHGHHPFDDDEGWMQLRERNIKTNKANFTPLTFYSDTEPDIVDLIRRMLSPEPEKRPTAAQVLAHPFFWSAEERLDFLSLASDRFDQEPRDGTSWALDHLESFAEDVIQWNSNRTTMTGGGPAGVALVVPERNFLDRLDPKFVATLGKQRKYHGGRMVDLLRALRNKHHHWDDMPDDVKRRVGEIPEGYLAYWEERFVGLVLYVWRAVREVGFEQERRFRKYFEDAGVVGVS